MEVPLDGAHGATQSLGQGLHLGPAQAALVVGVVGEGTICRDRLGGDSGEDEGLDLRDTRKLGLLGHLPPPISGAAGTLWRSLMVRFTKAVGLGQKVSPPLFLCSFYWCVLYLHRHPRASSWTTSACTTVAKAPHTVLELSINLSLFSTCLASARR